MWILIALLAPMLSTAGFAIDKYLLSAHPVTLDARSVVVISGCFSVFVFPAILFFEPYPLDISGVGLSILILNGILTSLAVLFYLAASREGDVFSVVIMLQLIPACGLVIGYLLLGETVTWQQFFGAVLVMAAASVSSFESSLKFKPKPVLFSAMAAILVAWTGTVFKVFAVPHGYWQTQFWEYVGILLFAIAILALSPQTRRNLGDMIIRKDRMALTLALSAEGCVVASDLILNFATLLAPVFLVYVVNSLQPVFVLLCVMAPAGCIPSRFAREHMARQSRVRCVLIILISFTGSVLIQV